MDYHKSLKLNDTTIEMLMHMLSSTAHHRKLPCMENEAICPIHSTLSLYAFPIMIATQRGRRQTHLYQSNIHEITSGISAR